MTADFEEVSGGSWPWRAEPARPFPSDNSLKFGHLFLARRGRAGLHKLRAERGTIKLPVRRRQPAIEDSECGRNSRVGQPVSEEAPEFPRGRPSRAARQYEAKQRAVAR